MLPGAHSVLTAYQGLCLAAFQLELRCASLQEARNKVHLRLRAVVGTRKVRSFGSRRTARE